MKCEALEGGTGKKGKTRKGKRICAGCDCERWEENEERAKCDESWSSEAFSSSLVVRVPKFKIEFR